MTDVQNPADAAARLEELARDYGLTMAAEFVPYSRSRNAKPSPLNPDGQPWESLNWRVSLEHNGRQILATDYAQGIAHIPGFKQGCDRSIGGREAVKEAIESGRSRFRNGQPQHGIFNAKAIPAPPIVDVLGSLLLDASAIDHPTFESWAGDYGYSEDSRSAEAVYRACLAHALALRSALGDDVLSAMRELATEL